MNIVVRDGEQVQALAKAYSKVTPFSISRRMLGRFFSAHPAGQCMKCLCSSVMMSTMFGFLRSSPKGMEPSLIYRSESDGIVVGFGSK